MEIEIIKSKKNQPVPIVNGISLHSRYDPISEGNKITKDFITKYAKEDKITVFGLGFGYHILPLLKTYPEIIIYEPSITITEKFKKFTHYNKIISNCSIINHLSQLPDISDTPVFVLRSEKRVFPEQFNKFTALINSKQKRKPNKNKLDISKLRIYLVNPIYGGSLTTSQYLKTALEEANYNFKTSENEKANKLLQKILRIKNKKNSNYLANQLIDLLSNLMWHEIISYDPHLIIFVAQSPISKDFALQLEKTDVSTAFWFVEDYRRFPYWSNYANYFDLFLTIQNDKFPKILRESGLNNFSYLPMAACKSIHKPVELTPENKVYYGSDISFMGEGYPNRHNLFSHLTEYDLKIWGTGWENNLKLQPYICKNGQRVTTEETVKIYNATKININLHSSMSDSLFEKDGNFINPRTFEILACGGFQLVDDRNVIREIFEPGKDIVTFNSIDDLKQKIDYYLINEDERKIIAERGREKVLSSHTYQDRLKEIINETNNFTSKLQKKIKEEKKDLESYLQKIKDPEFKLFLKNIHPEAKKSLPHLIEKVKNNKGKLKNYEAILLVLETFLKNEG